LLAAETGNDLIGVIPPEVSLLVGLKDFLAPQNSLSGDLDLAFAELTSLQSIAVLDNRLSGLLPTRILSKNIDLFFLDLGGNLFSGPIPSEIARASRLTDLKLHSNLLMEGIPSEIGSLSELCK
jgi:Leucine-rich repeat (LRR) protein